MIRKISNILLIVIPLFFSCKQSATGEIDNEVVDTANIVDIDCKQQPDSLQQIQILNDALEIAYKNIGNDKFNYKYTICTHIVEVIIDMDYHFIPDSSCLIIHRLTPGSVYIDIYSKAGNKFEKILSLEEWGMTYINDTIYDINGDGLKDFVVNQYGSTGCCLKAFSDVYLLQKNKKSFSDVYSFLNPTFSPNEKVIRGIDYGHPGETSMYKYQWNGEQVDTLEEVYYEINTKGKKTGKIIIEEKGVGKSFKRLNSVPAEYKNIYGYDWFTGKW